jgi:hypothetical protein
MSYNKKKEEDKKILIPLDDILEMLIYDSWAYCWRCKKIHPQENLFVSYDTHFKIICSKCNNRNYFS